ncbi:2-oxoacid:acceptor oxidoreductase family protein [Schwartzia succinivorans]|jgi:2-oxoglutarate ferredoxin oxidoreductase subunit gamma|uniref:2-oxoglutarate ferredoxin oxidoreductase subunit gamma n=1 Tax=Schwartzia succinivorans DSM 10502 TaxID=1123243 RepID=A0A1M4S7R3_9FIRM|nr:2-oxoacid:acceptor oxidoreductase family protein [Schwartzia succinivorans]SHE28246.1 2-oxoglutarate ferredoxin oxidoreductase subunit gamma [Schwartzia succinivorans DSM 10502]
MKQTFRFSGTGGQGLITAGIILAEAALLDGKMAIQSQSYGPEARGGSSKAEVIISDEAIHFGRVMHPETLLVMSQEAADKYSADCTPDSLIITDSLFVENVPVSAHRVDLPITRTAVSTCGKALFANIVALGAVAALTNCVSVESLTKAVLDRVPKGTEDANKKALAAGIALAKGVAKAA